MAAVQDVQCYVDVVNMIENGDISAYSDFMSGIRTGPGGLSEMSATPLGLAGETSLVGHDFHLAQTGLETTYRSVVQDTGSCRQLVDPDTLMSVVVDASDRVLAHVIQNPVVETVGEVRIGYPLSALQAEFPDLETEETETGLIAGTPVVEARESYGLSDTRRTMIFVLNEDHRIVELRIGIPTAALLGCGSAP